MSTMLVRKTGLATAVAAQRRLGCWRGGNNWRGAAGRRSNMRTSNNKLMRASSSSSSFTTLKDSEPKVLDLPDQAHVIVVGGGIIGTSVAYHLVALGVPDVLLLERDRLTSGTTWHAAGLMNSFGSLSATSTWMRQYTKELYSTILPAETGLSTGWMEIGFIELACDADRLAQYQRTAAFNRLAGVNVQEISPQQVQERFPLCHTEDDVLAGFFVESDGRANPTDTTLALAKGARQRGARIVEGVRVAGVTTTTKTTTTRTNNNNNNDGMILPTVTGVCLEDGRVIQANKVVNCAGMWARQFAENCGVLNVPNQAAEHYYLITEPMEEVDPSWPVVEDSSRYVYIRPEAGGLMLGLFEGQGAPWKPDSSIPEDFSFGEIEPDWDRLAPYIEAAMERVPAVQNVGIKKLFCGPESFTPDGCPIIGESNELRNYYVAAGLNSLGILTGGGVGSILAQWIRDGHPPNSVDVTGIDASRFHRYQNNSAFRSERVGEVLGDTYKVHYPDHQWKTCRNAKQSALHERLVAANAYFREASGWESPAWYAPSGVEATVSQESFGRENWFPYWAAEHNACRNDVALFDMSFMCKFLVSGNHAGAFLNRLSTANVDAEAGRITYTQWLSEQGFVAADLTVTKLADNEFMVVATDTQHNQVLAHMNRRLQRDDHVFVADVTARYAQINLQGPRSMELLQQITPMNMQSLAFRDAVEIEIGLSRVLCTRITYVGELGYELFIPVEQARMVYDHIVEAGAKFNLRHAGLRALGSLRLEKGYRDYGHDIDNTDSLLECGLGFTCDFDKEVPFIGQEHVLRQKTEAKSRGGLSKRMVSVLCLDPDVLLHHGEVLWRNGKRMTELRSASYGHTLGGGVGLAMLDADDEPIKKSYLETGTWEIEVGNTRYPCQCSLQPLYDPKNQRVKG